MIVHLGDYAAIVRSDAMLGEVQVVSQLGRGRLHANSLAPVLPGRPGLSGSILDGIGSWTA
ncbi:hypothetical protein GCM10009741_32710 [Kribbella lupini]|uniref:Uncharacterized protein n=1 Tax=Kribbella lupini TaxID=291602 RepID=A0ABN2AVP3_9ACTN